MTVHRFLGYVLVGSVLLHIGVKLPDIGYGLSAKVPVIAYAGLAALRGRRATWALAMSATWALLVNHLLNKGW